MEISSIFYEYTTEELFFSYTPLNGEYSNVWFDRKEISIEAQECRKSLSKIYETVNELLSREINGCGIASNRIVVGGKLTKLKIITLITHSLRISNRLQHGWSTRHAYRISFEHKSRWSFRPFILS